MRRRGFSTIREIKRERPIAVSAAVIAILKITKSSPSIEFIITPIDTRIILILRVIVSIIIKKWIKEYRQWLRALKPIEIRKSENGIKKSEEVEIQKFRFIFYYKMFCYFKKNCFNKDKLSII